MDALPALKTARIAPYIESIAQARKVGRTWEEIRQTLTHLEIADTAEKFRQTYQRARRRYEQGSLAPAQMPLPQGGADINPKPEESANQNEAEADTESHKPLEANAKKKTPQQEAKEAGLFDKYG